MSNPQTEPKFVPMLKRGEQTKRDSHRNPRLGKVVVSLIVRAHNGQTVLLPRARIATAGTAMDASLNEGDE
jgi:hypothetical protein